MSDEPHRLAEQLRLVLDGAPWLGPSLMDLLGDVTAEEATARPVPAAHTIAELAGHLLTWAATARVRLSGVAAEPTPEEDWPPLHALDAAAWEALRERVHREHAITPFPKELHHSVGRARWAVRRADNRDRPRVPQQLGDVFVAGQRHGGILSSGFNAPRSPTVSRQSCRTLPLPARRPQ